MAVATTRWAVTLLVALAATWTAACSNGSSTEIPAFKLDVDTDTGTGTDTEEETVADECPENYLDSQGRCIRYVNFASVNQDCGFNWETAFNTIQPAIDAAYAAAIQIGHCDVWVATGTYYSFTNAPTDSVRLKPNVSVYGGFAGDEFWMTERDFEAYETIIDGREQGGAGQSYHVVMGSNDADIDGFTITGGRAVGDPPHHRGGGVYLNAANGTVLNCKLIGNEAIDGGGVFAYDSWPVVESSQFIDNHAERGGGMMVLNGFAHLTSVRFENNHAQTSGGGIYFEKIYSACFPAIDEAEFITNTAEIDGGAVYNISCNPTIDAALFDSNQVGEHGGAIATYRGSFDLSESLLTGNRAAQDGGGFYGRFSDTAISHSDFEENQALGDAGGAYCELTDAAIYASSFVANEAGADGGGITVYFDETRVINTLDTPMGGRLRRRRSTLPTPRRRPLQRRPLRAGGLQHHRLGQQSQGDLRRGRCRGGR
jgi:predicted outer membrane repeat protein